VVIKNPTDLLRRVYDIFKLLHIIFRSPESKYENDDDVTELNSFLIILNAKIHLF